MKINFFNRTVNFNDKLIRKANCFFRSEEIFDIPSDTQKKWASILMCRKATPQVILLNYHKQINRYACGRFSEFCLKPSALSLTTYMCVVAYMCDKWYSSLDKDKTLCVSKASKADSNFLCLVEFKCEHKKGFSI